MTCKRVGRMWRGPCPRKFCSCSACHSITRRPNLAVEVHEILETNTSFSLKCRTRTTSPFASLTSCDHRPSHQLSLRHHIAFTHTKML